MTVGPGDEYFNSAATAVELLTYWVITGIWYFSFFLFFSQFVFFVLLDVAGRMERTRQLSDEVQAQAESRRHTLTTMIELANKISTSQSSLLSGLKDAKHVFGRLQPAADDSIGLQDRRDALQVFTSLCCVETS